MSFSKAIETKYITDYKLWLPSIHEDNDQLNQELSSYDINSMIKAKCQFLFQSILNTGIRKCIIYCVDTNEIKEMMTAIDTMNDFYCMEYNMNYITCNCNEKMRKNVMQSFATLNAIQLLFSVRIMEIGRAHV